MKRLLPLLALAAGACVKPAPETARGFRDDPCFTEREKLQFVAAGTQEPHRVAQFRALDAECEKRADALIAEATKARASQPDRALELLERAIAIASKTGDALPEARDLRQLLLVETASTDPTPDDEVTAYLQDAEQYEREGDWASVRDALRSALSFGPNVKIQERLREVESRCRLEANTLLAEARAHEAKGEIDAAYESVDQALVFADPDSTEADQGYEILDRLDSVSNEATDPHRDTGIGDLPPEPRQPPLDGSQVERMARARAAESADDWLAARYLWRQLAEEYASDAEIVPALERAEEKCLLDARRLIIEAKAYAAANNYAEADKLLGEALRRADRRGPEQLEAEKLRQKLQREGSPRAPTYDAPPADAPLAALLRAGEVSVQRQDWLAAREIYRRALSTNPGDEAVAEKLEVAHVECLRLARRQISEAKAYEAAVNYPEALKSLDLALLYADRVTDRENEQAKQIAERIRYGMKRP